MEKKEELQQKIDKVRAKIVSRLLVQFFRDLAKSKGKSSVTTAEAHSAMMDPDTRPHVRHVIFWNDRLTSYELRDGNPPANCDRPKFLKDMRLEIDVAEVEASIWEQFQPGGRRANMMRDRALYRDEPARLVEPVTFDILAPKIIL